MLPCEHACGRRHLSEIFRSAGLSSRVQARRTIAAGEILKTIVTHSAGIVVLEFSRRRHVVRIKAATRGQGGVGDSAVESVCVCVCMSVYMSVKLKDKLWMKYPGCMESFRNKIDTIPTFGASRIVFRGSPNTD